MNLSQHDQLWQEREIKTVANITQFALREFLPLTAEVPLQLDLTTRQLMKTNQAWMEMRQGDVKGAMGLVID